MSLRHIPQEQPRGALCDIVERQPPTGRVPGAGPVHRSEDEKPDEMRIARHMAGLLELVDETLPQGIVAVLECDDAAAIGGRERTPLVVQNGYEIMGIVKNGAELRADHANELILRRRFERHARPGYPHPLGHALLPPAHPNSLSCL